MSIHQGRIAESIFRAESLKRNLKIFAPVCDDHGCDFIIYNGVEYFRIQVKSTRKPDVRKSNVPTYKFSICRGANARSYDGNEFDYVACYIMDLDIWYIIPIASVLNKTTIRINPKSKNCKYFQYRDNFRVLS